MTGKSNEPMYPGASDQHHNLRGPAIDVSGFDYAAAEARVAAALASNVPPRPTEAEFSTLPVLDLSQFHIRPATEVYAERSEKRRTREDD